MPEAGPDGQPDRPRWLLPSGPIPRPGPREMLFDVAVAFCLLAPMKFFLRYTETISGFADRGLNKGTAISMVLAILVPLGLRRRYPLAGLWVIMAELAVIRMPLANTGLAVLIAGYSAAVYSPYRRLALWSQPFVLIELLALRFYILIPGDNLLVSIPIAMLLFAAATFYGVEIRRQAVFDVGEQQRKREEQQQEVIRRAVEGERSRIARELHDVVTHNVSVMVVMAGAARKVLAQSPDQATEALLAVETAGRAAMSELRQVMGLLTEDIREQHKLAPEPGLDQLGPLVSRIRATGVPLAYRVVGEPRPLPPGMDLTAYRVVQEALTNTVKHASGASVDIAVEYKPAALMLEIADTGGVAGQTAASGNGKGLIGLRERVAMHGGTVQAGPQLRGGYRVRVQIPLPAEDTV